MSDIQNMKPSWDRNTCQFSVCFRFALSDVHVYLHLNHIIENHENVAYEIMKCMFFNAIKIIIQLMNWLTTYRILLVWYIHNDILHSSSCIFTPFWITHTACNVRINISPLNSKHRLEHCPALKCISFTTGSVNKFQFQLPLPYSSNLSLLTLFPHMPYNIIGRRSKSLSPKSLHI